MSSFTTMHDTDIELHRLLDERAIRRRLTDYCRGIDRLDAELIRSVYHRDATDHHGSYRGSGVGFADYVVPRLREQWRTTTHTIANCTIDFLDADAARVETYVRAAHVGDDQEGSFVVVFVGRYVDRFERREDEWRISDRVVVHDFDWRQRLDTAFPPDKFTVGRRDRSDPSYG
jgi:hypothetical protein